jgi:RNA-binding, Nab2-type zinc finger
VQWKPVLVSTRYVETSQVVSPKKILDARDFDCQEGKLIREKAREDLVPQIDYRPPRRIKMDEYILFGKDSNESLVQSEREKMKLSANYFRLSDVPMSPYEPESVPLNLPDDADIPLIPLVDKIDVAQVKALLSSTGDHELLRYKDLLLNSVDDDLIAVRAMLMASKAAPLRHPSQVNYPNAVTAAKAVQEEGTDYRRYSAKRQKPERYYTSSPERNSVGGRNMHNRDGSPSKNLYGYQSIKIKCRYFPVGQCKQGDSCMFAHIK